MYPCMDVHRSYIVRVYTHNKDHVVLWLGSLRIQCIHGHPCMDHSLYACTYMYMYMSHGWVVREYNNFFTTIIMSLEAE